MSSYYLCDTCARPHRKSWNHHYGYYRVTDLDAPVSVATHSIIVTDGSRDPHELCSRYQPKEKR